MANYRELTPKDVKILKEENRISYISCLILFLFLGVITLLIYLTSCNISHLTIIIDSVVVIMAVIIAYLINRPRNKDIVEGFKMYEIRKVIEVSKEVVYEAGSAHYIFLLLQM